MATALFDTCSFRIVPVSEIVLMSLDGTVPSLKGPKNSVVRFASRSLPSIPENEHWKQAQSDAMFRIAELERDGRVCLFTYSEIEIELLKGTLFPCSFASDCFAGITINNIPAAIERSKFEMQEFQSYSEKISLIRFCQWLLAIDYREAFGKSGFISKLSNFERNNLALLDRFKEICMNLAEKHYPDAFHLWTAEVNHLDFFLTADKKFIDAITMSSRIALRTRPISPSEFIQGFKV